MVRTVMTTTPPATSRADTSLTGLGNENSFLSLLDAGVVVSVPLIGFLSEASTIPPNPDQITRLSATARGRWLSRHWAPVGAAVARRSGRTGG